MPHTDLLSTIPATMRAIALLEPNEQINLSELELPVPDVVDNELLIKVEYVALNPVDAYFAKQGFCKWHYPHTLGLDAVGVVVKATKGVFPSVGTRVMWHGNVGDQGVLSQYAKVPNFAVSQIPDSVTLQQAATLPCAGMSALIALDKLQLTEGDSLLIEAGAGAVGQFAIQFAKQRGATVFTTASKRNHKLVKQLGADVVFDYNDKKLSDKIRKELGPQGFDAVLDSIGGETTVRNVELMRFCGRIACLNPLPKFEQELMFRRAPNIGIVSLGGAWLANSLCAQQKMSFMGNLLLDNLASGSIKIPQIIEVEFNASSISQALNKQIAGGFTGKQVVKISHD
ncbi:zinc-binding dehydrogenase [Pseudoalteromonas sp. SG43-7]|jgi:NADPH:quinone reductase-like Zn-dependent oxidoreductase|uniref:Zinc-binding dehydrogenase n=2 Tax=Pseudoalteromonas TaxID=53246 RepID=A0ABY3FFS7_9GAMM|nr:MULTISPECIES: zinc-binding dehydrogenase [Pseudoalteromonas]MBB1416651.1 zinc-binding dehydrogenase [Pseudoalteromonas sp. SG44-1]MBB1423340.1 zinc-binding dehydrogenase [Pseudoalteromonas sp. SG43-7]MBB1435280.1 zinc-binding dehydrogenase [Pseudoalteromonas sp. SG43-6]MBB1479298.1 zinc-binding dehydrogenase [Pseudoalteromonas sp. SG41-2]MBB1504462.1 zinc-binding dehydrogenase [Pseudoalteromonas sp. SG41-1]|tara:strand:- start:9010 stop:10035 length:1026 start_codon:yes stop_codon:yes gene_type:complete